MKPCRVSSIALGKRPQTGKLEPSKSEPKIYCKALLPGRQKARTSAVDFSASTRRPSRMKEHSLKSSEAKKLELLAEGKVDGWNRSKENNEEEDFWLR
jgi:hypothetical protein